MTDAIELARRTADALESAGLPYAIGGAIAYGFHGPPRATNDVDVNVFVDPGAVDEVLDALALLGPIDREAARASVEARGDFQIWIDGMRVDIFLPSVPVMDSASKRVTTAELGGRAIHILAAEDLALFKLLYYRPKDLVDLERLVAFMGADLDVGYVRRWLIEMVGEDDHRVATWDGWTRT